MSRIFRSDRSRATGMIDPENELIFSIDQPFKTTFSHTGGFLEFPDNFTAPSNPVFKTVEVPARTGITVDNIATTGATFIYFNDDGSINQQSTFRGGAFLRDHIAGTIIQHADNVTINSNSNATQVALPNMSMGFADLSFAMGNVATTEGGKNRISGVTGTSKVQKASGSYNFHAINARNSNKIPNIIQSAALDGSNILTGWSVTDQGAGQFILSTTGIVFGIFDDGTAVLADALPQGIVGTSDWVNNRILLAADSNDLVMQYGNTVYPTAVAARIGLSTDNFEIIPSFLAIVALGVVTMRGGGTDTTDPDDTIFTQAREVRAGYV